LNTATGKVTYKGDPIKGAVVVFIPKGGGNINSQRPSGQTGEDGSYSLATGSKPGAPPGEYEVTITWNESKSKSKAKPGKISMDGDEEEVRDRLGGRFAQPGKSGLQASIKSGSNTIPTFELK